MLNFSSFMQIHEGKNDPAIFKAVFLAGGPGSGKSFIASKAALSSMGFKIINSDQPFEAGMKRAGMELSTDNIFSPRGQEIRGRAKNVTKKREERFIDGRLGLVIDGTGKDYNKIKEAKQKLEAIGYETAMIFVNTTLDTAVDRDKNRDRVVGKTYVSQMWQAVQRNLGHFQSLFGNNFYVVDNNATTNIDKSTLRVYRRISQWAKKTPRNRPAKQWLDAQ